MKTVVLSCDACGAKLENISASHTLFSGRVRRDFCTDACFDRWALARCQPAQTTFRTRASTDWDRLWKEDPEAFHSWPENELVRWASTLEPGSKVLEVGCGNGANLRALRSFDLEVWGVDIAKEALLASPSLWHGCEVKVGSATELEFPSESFDAVADVQCLQHLASSDLPKAYGEIARVLKPKGRFFSMHLVWGQELYPSLSFAPCRPGVIAQAGFDIRQGTLSRHWVDKVVDYALIDAVKHE